MPTVHANAVIEGEVDLADDVVVGPYCVVTGPVTIGAGTQLVASVHVQGPATIGRDNILYPNVCLGFAPQSVAYDPAHPGEGLVIGDQNTLRESVTMHRAMTEEGPTRVGNNNFFMAYAHVGHDCRVGDRGTFANSSSFGGHVQVGNGVTLGGGAGVHQWVRLGRGVMVQGNAGVTQDVIPFGLVTGINVCANVNIIGMRRSGMSSAEIDLVRWIHRTVCRRGLLIANALEVLRERSDQPLVAEYIDFIERAKRGVCPGRSRERQAPLRTP